MDFVEEVLRFLTARMQIEAEWAVQEQTSFTWWAHTLAQRVWVAPPREFQGVELTTLHIETDLLADVPMDASTWARLAERQPVRHAQRLRRRHRASGPIRLHSSVSLTDGQLAAGADDRAARDGAADGRCLRRSGGTGRGVRRPRRRDAAPAARPARAAGRDGRHPRDLPAARRRRFAVQRRRDRASSCTSSRGPG